MTMNVQRSNACDQPADETVALARHARDGTNLHRTPDPMPHRFGRAARSRRPDLLNVFEGILVRGTLRFPFGRPPGGEWRAWLTPR